MGQCIETPMHVFCVITGILDVIRSSIDDINDNLMSAFEYSGLDELWSNAWVETQCILSSDRFKCNFIVKAILCTFVLLNLGYIC